MMEQGVLLPHQCLLLTSAAELARERPSSAVSALLDDPAMSWPDLVADSVRHGTATLLAQQFQQLAALPGVPQDVLNCLDRIYIANGKRNDLLFAETGRLIRALDAAGIKSLVLKGVALALTVYPEHALRNFADIDLLVKEEEFERAGNLMTKMGFERLGGEPHARQQEVGYQRDCGQDILTETLAGEFDPRITPELLEGCRSLIKVEIHRSVLREPDRFTREADMEPFWDGARSAALPDGTAFWYPSDESMLVHLCDHAAGHGFRRLLFPVDVAILLHVRGEAIDWGRAGALATHCGASGSVRRMLVFLRDQFEDTSLTDVITGWLPAEQCSGEYVDVRPEDVFRAAQMDDRDMVYAQVFAELRDFRRWRGFLHSLRHALLPPPEVVRANHKIEDRAALARFYACRPFNLAAHVIHVACRRQRLNRTRGGSSGRAGVST